MITAATVVQNGHMCYVSVTSDMTAPIYYYWYLDGLFVSMTFSNEMSFAVEEGEYAVVECIDSNDPTLDPFSIAPDTPSSRNTIMWHRDLTGGVAQFDVYENIYTPYTSTLVRSIPVDQNFWYYTFRTRRLTDLLGYYHLVGNISNGGSAYSGNYNIAIKTVRRPDPVRWAFTYDADTDLVEFAEAS